MKQLLDLNICLDASTIRTFSQKVYFSQFLTFIAYTPQPRFIFLNLLVALVNGILFLSFCLFVRPINLHTFFELLNTALSSRHSKFVFIVISLNSNFSSASCLFQSQKFNCNLKGTFILNSQQRQAQHIASMLHFLL